MLEYVEFNANPKGRKTGDCVTRAISRTLDISYEDTLYEQYVTALKHYYSLAHRKTINYIMEFYGYVKMKQPRKYTGKKYTVGEMDDVLTEKQMEEGVLISVANHMTCIKHGVVQDIWDCRDKTVGNYWVRKEK